MQEFQFKFMVMTVKATVDDGVLTVKQGLRTFRAEISRLRHLYLIDHEGVGQELLLTHEVGPDKLKRIRFNSDFGQQQFGALVDALLALRPDIDIRNLPPGEAHKIMGATNWVAKAPIIGVTIMVLVVGFGFIPGFIHGLDGGQQTIAVSDCAAECEVDTRNLSVKGVLLVDHTAEKETTTTRSGSTTSTIRYFIPLVPRSWKPGDQIYMVVETPDLTEAEFKHLGSLPALPGVLRDVWWEGLGSDAREFFEQTMSLNLAPEVRLLEYRADPKEGMWIGLIAMGVTLVIMVAASIAIARKKKKRLAG